MEIISAGVELAVQAEEYIRLLGYPRGYILADRALELAEGARAWYARHGSPWMYARESASFRISESAFVIDDVSFEGVKLRQTLERSNASSVIVAAVGAGSELEAEAQRLWLDEKPDEYFFLEVYGSAVVEHLVTTVGAQLCAMADSEQRAVLPHYSPGYPEWDITEQSRLLDVLRGHNPRSMPGELSVLDSGMLRPKKSLLAAFGVTKDSGRVRALTDLNPCTGCSLPKCAYRRVAYRRPRSRVLAEI